MPDQKHNGAKRAPKLSRRAFLKGTGLVAAATGAGALASCQPAAAPAQPGPTPVLTLDDKYLHVPPAPALPPDPNVLLFFTTEEARAVEALTARLLPGSEADPGAREAGVVIFIDRMLAQTEGYAEPTYTQPPYPRFYAGEAPPPEAADTDPSQVIWVPEEWKDAYGWQCGAPPQTLYRAALGAIANMAGGDVTALSEAEQDELLETLTGDEAPPEFEALDIPGFSAAAFFELLLTHTIHGLFGDPLYGGNRYLVGWQLVGYPGARRAYTEHDMLNEGPPLEPQSLAHLPPFHPGQPVGPGVILPVANGNLIQQQAEQAHEAERRLFCEVRK